MSIWAVPMPRFAPLDGDLKTDVLIIGGGMAGLLCGYRLQEAGVSCTILEADRICSGVTQGTTAKITSQHGLIYSDLLRRFGRERAKLYLEANQKAVEAYRQLCDPEDFQEQDAYVYTLSRPDRLEREDTALRELGFPASLVEKTPLPLPVVGALRFPGQGQFHPLKFLGKLAKNLQIYEQTPVRELAPHQAVTDRGTVTAKKIVVATHFPILNKHGLYFLKMYQQRSYVLALENAQDLTGMYLDEGKNGLSFRAYGSLLLLGGGGHRTGKPGGGWRTLEEFAGSHYPQARIVDRWAAQDCMTLDGVPYIGRYSRFSQDLYVATGFNKWGVTSSMVAAGLLRDQILGRENPYEALYSPSRGILRPQLALNAWESTVGLLTPSSKRCPHLGCALKWNPQERSWDCPCHGSRFSEEGALLDDPATGGLEK